MRTALVLALALWATASTAATPEGARAVLSRLYPQIRVTSFEPSPVPGLFEVRSDDTLFYFAEVPGLLLFGELFDPSGTSLTGARREALGVEVRHNPPLRPTSTSVEAMRGVSIRGGDVSLTAFLDVHCGYCAQSVEWLLSDAAVPKAALNVVFVSRTPADLARAEHVLCAPPELRATALRQAFATGDDTEWLRCTHGHDEALAHERIAAEAGVSATPVFAVSGQTVLGFNRARLESLVDQSGRSPKE